MRFTDRAKFGSAISVRPAVARRAVEHGLVLALSGPLGAGKTTLAKGLRRSIDAAVVSTRYLLRQRQQATDNRLALQELGEALDEREGGLWVARPVLKLRNATPSDIVVVVDAVRTREQINQLRAGSAVAHVHLTAADAVLSTRYAARRAQNPATELASFQDARANATEAAVEELGLVADLVLDTGRLDIDATREAALKLLQP